MSARLSDRPVLELESPEAWREWLSANHDSSPGVWLAIGKKGGTRTAIGYEPAVEEALCWGWIDSVTRRLDDDRYLQSFTPRKRDGAWAPSNKKRVERLIAEGRMQPAGLAAIEAAKASGAWSALDEVEALVVPEDLRQALSRDTAVSDAFEALGDSAKKMTLYWIASARRAATREKRITATLDALERGESPL